MFLSLQNLWFKPKSLAPYLGPQILTIGECQGEHVFFPKSVGKMSPQVVESENDPIFWGIGIGFNVLRVVKGNEQFFTWSQLD